MFKNMKAFKDNNKEVKMAKKYLTEFEEKYPVIINYLRNLSADETMTATELANRTGNTYTIMQTGYVLKVLSTLFESINYCTIEFPDVTIKVYMVRKDALTA